MNNINGLAVQQVSYIFVTKTLEKSLDLMQLLGQVYIYVMHGIIEK